jgi:hypothetical protein
MCDSQDVALHSGMSDGVATVSQTLGWGAKGLRKLVQTPDFANYASSAIYTLLTNDVRTLHGTGTPRYFLLALHGRSDWKPEDRN